MQKPKIIVLYGGVGEERDISLVSGNTVFKGLENVYSPLELVDLKARELPDSVLNSKALIFPVLHGEFGEDGQPQALLEAAGLEFVGSGSKASALCMDKVKTKHCWRSGGLAVLDEVAFQAGDTLDQAAILEKFGPDLVIKKSNGGSSVGIRLPRGAQELAKALQELEPGSWMIERRLFGRELTIGILHGQPMGIVEIKPKVGVYDLHNKYTPGATEYILPAPLDPEIQTQMEVMAQKAFNLCGCRDFARVDFIMDSDGNPYLMEINTIPGFTTAGLFPKSASILGYDLPKLLLDLIKPALERYNRTPAVT